MQIFWHRQLSCVLKCEVLGLVCGLCANVDFPTYASVLQSKKHDNVFCCAVEGGGTQLLFATDVFYATETVLKRKSVSLSQLNTRMYLLLTTKIKFHFFLLYNVGIICRFSMGYTTNFQ